MMKWMLWRPLLLAATAGLCACGGNGFEYDASGTFEATEVLVSAEASGRLVSFDLEEGDVLEAGRAVGLVDTVQLHLRKVQLLATKLALRASRPDRELQVAATKEQIAKAKLERARLGRLFEAAAATQKQLDDMDSQLKVLEGSLAAQVSALSNTIGNLDEQGAALDAQVAQVDDLLAKSRIVNPIRGTVLGKYAEAHELVGVAKPLYKIADVERLFLRAYIVSSQLEAVSIGQRARVFVNMGPGGTVSYPGRVAWISSKAEFTPKTIQTKDERQNLVYAVKVAVDNADGLLKIGMYGDVRFGEGGE